MADSVRRYTFAPILLALSFFLFSSIAHAATFTVNNTLDSGGGSLRDAISNANAAPTVANTINFSVSGTITLLSVLPAIVNTSPGSLTIDGSGQAITVDGANSFQVFSVSAGATLNLQNLTVAHGQAGLLDNGGGVNNNGTLMITAVTFSDNNAPKVGGAIDSHGMLTVTGSTFSGGNASFGGGIFNDTGTLTVINSTFSDNNAARGGEGGGIANHQGTLTITSTTFDGNTAPGGTGGAVFSNGTSQVTIINSTFAGNHAADGGAIFDSIDSNISVTNCTFSGNQADLSGGAIFNNNGGIDAKSTILAGSTGGNCAGTIGDAGHNISDDGTCGFSGTSVNNSTTLNLDPAGLQNNGGPTQTIAIEPNSQALNFIPIASCTDQSPTPQPLLQDQRGFPRPDSGNISSCDAGAFELQQGRIVVEPGSERTEIARSSNPNSDQVDLAFTFADLGSPLVVYEGAAPDGVSSCDAGNDALNGVSVDLFAGTCADIGSGGLILDLRPFVVHTIGHTTYGTIFQSSPTVTAPETVLARIVQAQRLWIEDVCGEWTLNIEVAGLDTPALNLGGGNPFALVLEDRDKNEGCFDVTNAVVGNQNPSRRMRRGARR